jgi:glucosamine--fructose-6-phosphate aminotransferase (isomerizing)
VLRLVASWADDERLPEAIDHLPDRLAMASELDWDTALAGLAEADSLIAIGRGPTLAIAREAALKLKEIANRHAEAFSGAEFLHGPVALVSTHYPILVFMPTDAAADGLRRLATDLAGKGAAVFAAGPRSDDRGPLLLPALAADHPETDAVCLIQSFYAMMVRLAERLGIDADRPRHLQKVTRTR